jgi:hypothetical protein
MPYSLRFIPTSLIVGAAITIVVAWACAMWSPVRSTLDPFPNPAGMADTSDPDGDVGLHGIESGFGWMLTELRGTRSTLNGREDIYWYGPWGGVYHRLAGWPMASLRSRVEVLDSDRANQVYEGEPEPVPVLPRRRWALPAGEIVHRGLATKDLPGWMHAQPDRRLPLIPMGLGFAVDTLVYAGVFALLIRLCRPAWRRLHAAPRGFPVVVGVR